MMLHHYIWGDIDIDIVEEVAPFSDSKALWQLSSFLQTHKTSEPLLSQFRQALFTPWVFDAKGKKV